MRQKIDKYMGVLFIISLFGLYVWAYFPGYMSHDSAVHYRQVLTGEWTTFQPVVFLALWEGTDGLLAGPGGLFLLFLFVFVVGLLLLLWGVQIKTWQKLFFLCLVMLAPVNLMLLPHLWKDVALMAFLMLALGLIVQSKQHHHLWLKAGALVCLGLAMSFRFEAVLYLWPLVFYALWTVKDKSKWYWRTGVLTVLFVLMVIVMNVMLAQLTDAKKITLWPSMALWDVAAVSIAVDKNLLPAFATGPDMTVEDLNQAFKSWSNIPLLSKTQAGINPGIENPYTDEEYNMLKQTWMMLPVRYTRAYFSHRWRLIKELLRIEEVSNKPKELYYVNKVSGFQSVYPKNSSALNHFINQWISKNINTFLLKPWFYLLLGFLACIFLVYRYLKGNNRKVLPLVISVSVFLNVVVMFFLAPAAETRYLIVAMNFCLLLWVLVFSTDRS